MGDENDVVYVAVNEIVRESEMTLLWTLKNLRVKKLYLLHVYVPFSFTSPTSGYNESEINAIHRSGIKTLDNNLHEYRNICIRKGLNKQVVDVANITGCNVDQGIVELIYQRNIKNLIMGAAADPHYFKGMSDITSKKAEYVSRYAPSYCKIWFICKGKLIKTSEGRYGLYNPFNSSGISGSNEPPSKPGHEERAGKGKQANPSQRPVASQRPVSEEPPEEYICPISLRIMKDPHLAADGYSYAPEPFRTWLSQGRFVSPMTQVPLAHHGLTPNYILRSLIDDWLKAHPDYSD